MIQYYLHSKPQLKILIFAIALVLAVAIGWATSKFGIIIPGVLIALPFISGIAFWIIYQPKIGLICLLLYGFFSPSIIRHFPVLLNFAYIPEILLVIIWVSILLNNKINLNWNLVKNDLSLIMLIWFGISVLQLFNPYGPHLMGGLSEIRSSALYGLLIVPLCFLIFNKKEDLDLFLKVIIGCSVAAALFGMKQLFIGLDAADQLFLDMGAAETHLIFGKLRIFSLYSDAGQFGASQALVGLLTLVLALGPFKKREKFLLISISLLLFYGMLISGTRGALFALISGLFIALLFSKKFKILFIGSAIALSALFILKYTSIGSSNYHINRMRTALNPEDPSLNVRFQNQEILGAYLKDYPFGGGMGIIGYNGHKYNGHKFLSTIEPDSYWVKVWAMYGIVGLIIWIFLISYIIGKCGGIIWNIRDSALKQKILAITAAAAGAFFCSYGNEVMNAFPSSIMVYISWSFIFLAPGLDKKILENNAQDRKS